MRRWGVRTRTTVAATVVVAVALAIGSAALVLLVRSSLLDGLETSAESRAEALAATVETSGVPTPVDADGEDDGPDEVVEAIMRSTDTGAELVWSTAGVGLPTDDVDSYRIGDDDESFLVVTEDAQRDGVDYVVAVGASREDVDETTAALVPPLLIGAPLLLLVVAGTTWIVTGRALRPVADIRAEVDEISGTDLGRRVPVPEAHDEIHGLATTMNAMLGRLEQSAEQQRRFVSDASHELRSPVASLRQAGEVATAHPDAMPADELAETVVAESVRMQRLVEQLLVLARSDEGTTGQSAEVDLDDLLLVAGQRVRGAGLTADVSGVGAVRVEGDSLALGQVVRNLTDNATRHASSTIALAVSESDRGVELTVDDDGDGVPADEREHVFDRFVRLDEARARDDGGSGLGLAIVREIVTRHGGSVTVGDSPLGGARFTVRLPG